ncbi:predicted protein [Nematostella vectensis]|uniref:3-hydroxyisobutyrate dehydrogenase n=1 Tax=Nematostella vectensis TaxID=45351 RepID=A7RG59_NEMVE|nr:predicted protein [Nematostella vectensis]|eukprot:XP_001641427.1 predicted protein [Nematostella vectensis]
MNGARFLARNAFLWRAAFSMSTSASPRTVGLVGTGNVGSAVAVGLRKIDVSVKAFDLQQNNYNFLESTGTTLVNSPEEVTKDVDVLITALPKPQHVKSALEDTGMLSMLKEGSVWIDHTTTDYNETIRLGELATSKGVHAVEAPLTGGQGLMTVFVGGEEKVVQDVKPLMDSYTATFLYFGPLGKATVAKVISNMLCAAHLVAAGEALMLAKKAGLDMSNFFDGIRYSAGNSYVFETEVPLMFNGSYDPDFTIDLHCKDLALGREIATSNDSPLELLGLTEDIYRRAMEKYGKDVGSSFPAKMLEDDTGISQQQPGWEKWSYTMERVSGGGIGVVHRNRGK